MPEEKPKHWISESLVRMLITELQDYKSAAEVISGCSSTFHGLANQIEAVLERATVEKVSFDKDLKPLLEASRDEIQANQQWQKEVMDMLPSNLTTPITAAFNKVVIDRLKLHTLVMEAPDRYLKVSRKIS